MYTLLAALNNGHGFSLWWLLVVLVIICLVIWILSSMRR